MDELAIYVSRKLTFSWETCSSTFKLKTEVVLKREKTIRQAQSTGGSKEATEPPDCGPHAPQMFQAHTIYIVDFQASHVLGCSEFGCC